MKSINVNCTDIYFSVSLDERKKKQTKCIYDIHSCSDYRHCSVTKKTIYIIFSLSTYTQYYFRYYPCGSNEFICVQRSIFEFLNQAKIFITKGCSLLILLFISFDELIWNIDNIVLINFVLFLLFKSHYCL